MISDVFGCKSEKHSPNGCAFFLECLKSIPTAALVSICCCVYAYVIELVSDFAAEHVALMLTMPIGCMVIHTINKEKSSAKTEPYLKVVTTWVSHFCGASVGKETVGIGFGKAVSDLACDKLRVNRKSISGIIGTVSAFSALFSTPVAGIVFYIEEKEAPFGKGDVVFAFIAALCAFLVSRIVGMRPIRFSTTMVVEFSLSVFLWMVAGCAFSALVARTYKIIRNRLSSAFGGSDLEPLVLLSALAMLMSFVSFQVLGNRNLNGLSTKLMTDSFLEVELSVQVFCLIAKLMLTAICFCAGFTGGDFIPFLVLGFLSGAIVAKLAGLNSMLIPFFSAFSCLAFGKRIPLTSSLLLLQAFMPDLLKSMI